jgi:hypothetical protein
VTADGDMMMNLSARDITEGLGAYFAPHPGFQVASFVEPQVIGNQAWVAWTFEGVHERANFAGIEPTGRSVVVHGVTLVDTTTDPPVFRRYIDWIDVCQQLGLSVTTRPAINGPHK